MAAAQGLYAEAFNVATANTTFVDVCSIADTSFTAGATYLIIANAVLLSTNTSINEVQARLVRGTTPTVFTDALAKLEVAQTTQKHEVSWMYVFTQPGTAEQIKIQIANSTTSNTTCEIGQIFALKLDDVGTQNTHWFYTEDTVDYTTTATKTAKAGVTFTPNGTDEWLILGQFAQTVGSTSANYLADINDSVAGVLASLDIEGEDTTNEVRSHLLMRVFTPTAVSHTTSMRFSHETTAGVIQSNRIFALNLSQFNQKATAFDATSTQPAASPSWTSQSISPTPSVTGDWFIMGFLQNDNNVQTDNLQVRLQVNASGGGLASQPAWGDDGPGQDSWDPTDVVPFNLFTMQSLTSGASRAINWDSNLTAGTTLRVLNRNLVAFSLELPSSTTPIAGSDSATLAEGTVNLLVILARTDTAALADATPSIAAVISGLTDSATLSESAPSIGLVLTDSLALSDPTPSLAAVLTSTDAVSLADSTPSIAATLSGTDAGALADGTPSLVVSATSSDSATATEGTPAIGLSQSDSGSVSEGTPQTGVGLSDAAVLTDTLSNAATVTVTDSAALADSTPSISASLSTSDSGSMGDSSSVSQSGSTTPSVSDAFTLSGEVATIAATLTASDVSTLTDAAELAAALSAADSISVAEIAAIAASVNAADVGVILEVLTLQGFLAATEEGTLTDSAVVVLIGPNVYNPFRPIGVLVATKVVDGTSTPRNPDGATTGDEGPEGTTT